VARRELVIGWDATTNEPWEVLSFSGPAADAVWGVVENIDGLRTIAELATASHQDVDEVGTLIQRLYHAGVIDDASGGDVPARACYEHLCAIYKFALASWGRSPLLDVFWVGPVSRRLALGFLIEIYHSAAAASNHQGTAVSTAPSARLKAALSEHLASEYWHFAWLRRGLLAAGLTEADLARAAPLPTTLGMINHLCWLAGSDPLAYSACIGVTERNSSALDVSVRFWDRFSSHAVLEEAVIAPFREHELLDCKENHATFGAEGFSERGPLSRLEMVRVRHRLLAYARLSHEMYRQILEWYGEPTGPAYFTLDDVSRTRMTSQTTHASEPPRHHE
jgi:hypothetical protein